MEILLLLPGFILAIMIVVMYEIKPQKPQNKVHFYIAKPSGYCMYYLYLGKPRRVFSNGRFIFEPARNGRFITDNIIYYNLNPVDFGYMEIGEIKEVFLNLED